MVKRNLTNRCLLAFAWGALLLASTAAHADAKAEAERHFETGKALYAAENYEGAAAEFEASVEAYPTKNGYYNLANCHKALHRYAEALTAIDELRIRLAAELQNDPALTAKVDKTERSIRELLGALRVTSTPPGAEITVDHQPVGTTPLSRALLLGPGEHLVTAKLQGFATAEQRVSVLSKSESRVAFELEPGQARLNVTVNALNAEVRLDGALVGLSPLQETLLVTPGHHMVDVALTGYLPEHRELALAASEEIVLDVTLVPEPIVQARVPAVSTRALGTLTWVGLGSAVVLGGTSAVLFYFRGQAIDEFNKEDLLYRTVIDAEAQKHKVRRDDAGSQAELFHGFAIGTAITAGVCAIGALTAGIVATSRNKGKGKGKGEHEGKAEVQAGLGSVGVRF